MARQPVIELLLRRPTPADYLGVVQVVNDWGNRAVHTLPRLWLEHFCGTSWVAETLDGRLAGFLVGFLSPDHPLRGVIVLAGTSPNVIRRDVGRRLRDEFIDDMRQRGAEDVIESIWPGDRVAVEFLRSIGFEAIVEPGMQRLYGVPAFADHEWGREDRAIFVRDIRLDRRPS